MNLPYADTTQNFLDIVDIKEDTLILKGSRFCMVLETTSLNFDLLSEKEQDAAIYAYANFVNSLEQPVQVVVRTRQVEIGKYIEYLEERQKLQPSEALREHMGAYINFVKQLVLESTILYKRFFLVVPYRAVTASTSNPLDPIMDLIPFLKQKTTSQYSQTAFDKAKQIFSEREQEIAWHFRRLGLEVKRLTTPELVKLFFKIYNPEIETQQILDEDTEGYFTPFVNAAVS